MSGSIDSIPHQPPPVRRYYRGVSDRGLNFELEVDRIATTNERVRNNVDPRVYMPVAAGQTTKEQVRGMMWLRIEETMRAHEAGLGLGVRAMPGQLATGETRINLRVAVPGKVRRIPVTVNSDGSYSANSQRSSSLRSLVRDVTSVLEVEHGLGYSPRM